MTEYESISATFPSNFPVHEATRQRNYFSGLINVALMMANVNQFKEMVLNNSCSTCSEYKVGFIVTFGITILLQLIMIVVLVLDTKLLGNSLEDFRRSVRHSRILLYLGVILVVVDLIAIIVTDDWNNKSMK